ncbi:transforming acidic coiled-coil-containing protein 3 isoform X2 [Ceratina calcarata]|uniref:Transforming acidic coiled-coil-containing protein 3 isoform X2 n=1 Tax=Ceratina calcarata TaxID=156304 RepID=A0AAJ7W8Y1_9HYME|nr:transforming acidic coiled-coil-containing protein 3 isoform X2 [Ceratina calcarata]
MGLILASSDSRNWRSFFEAMGNFIFKSGSDNTTPKAAEHEVKVQFAREFADVETITCSAPRTVSSARSVHSRASTNGNDSSLEIPHSYVNSNISGLDDLIHGVAKIELNSDDERSFNASQNSDDFSLNQTFASATEFDSSRLPNDSISEIIEQPTRTAVCVREPPPVVLASPGRRCSFIKLEVKLDELVENPESPEQNYDSHNSKSKTNSSLANDIEESPLNSKTNESLSKKNVDHLEKADAVNSTKQEESKELTESESENRDSESSPSDLQDVLLNSEVSGVEQHSESKLETENSSLTALDIKQPSFEELKTELDSIDLDKFENISLTPEIDSSIKLEKSYNAFLNAEELEKFIKSKLEEQNNSLTTLCIEQPSLEELKTSTTEQATNELESVDLEKFHSALLNAEELIESEPQEQATSLATLSIEQPKEESKASKQIVNELNTTVCLDEPQDVSQNFEGLPEAEPCVEFKPQSTSLNTLDVERLTSELQEVVEQVANKSDSGVTPDEPQDLSSKVTPEVQHCIELKPQRQSTSLTTVDVEQPSFEESIATEQVASKLDSTTDLHEHQDVPSNHKVTPKVEQYEEFKPQRQSTSLATLGSVQPDFEELKAAAAEQVANDIFNSSLGLSGDTDCCFVTATSDIFQDPTSFDFLMNHGRSHAVKLRTESLYIKFDPLASNVRMLPQGNAQPIDGEQNEKSESVPADINTPKRSPAISAIDRLLFYSPLSTSMTQKADETQEKVASKEQPTEEPIITEINMSKELELVRTSVLHLEEQLEKSKKEYQAELEKQQEKISKLQGQLEQEVKSKSQMTVVVEEYEKSISRLLTERERDRTNFEQEKGKLQEEVQSTNLHLANMEVAFSDIHHKYEKLKAVVSAYKNNESVLKESIQENLETIKGLEIRYEQLKNHAMSQLEKANYELDAMRKQHEDETVTLHAMVRKAELKSNSLAELVEQKIKENKELTQILDEVIARVGHQNAE